MIMVDGSKQVFFSIENIDKFIILLYTYLLQCSTVVTAIIILHLLGFEPPATQRQSLKQYFTALRPQPLDYCSLPVKYSTSKKLDSYLFSSNPRTGPETYLLVALASMLLG